MMIAVLVSLHDHPCMLGALDRMLHGFYTL